MGMRERLFLWLVLILAASLVLAIAIWLADDLGLAIAGDGLSDTLLTLALIAILISVVLLAIIGPGVVRSRSAPPDMTIKRR
jgi:hypothetical protein